MKISKKEDLIEIVHKLNKDFPLFYTLLVTRKHQHDSIVEKDQSFNQFGDELIRLIGADNQLFTSKDNIRHFLRKIVKDLRRLSNEEHEIRKFLFDQKKSQVHELANKLFKLSKDTLSNLDKLERNLHQQRVAVQKDSPKEYLALVSAQYLLENAINKEIPSVLKKLKDEGIIIHALEK